VGRLLATVALTLALAAPAALARPTQEPLPPPEHPAPEIAYRHSVPVGVWWNGALRRGVQMPAEGPDWFTWDGVLDQAPNRGWRRWGTAALIRTTLAVLREYREANPGAPRVGIGDISRQHGGHFGREFGGLGHASHQNGLDADVYYPRADRRLLAAFKPELIDHALAQDLLDRFVAAGAQFVFIGTRTHLRGPRKVVEVIAHHNDHMHVRILPPRG